MTRKIILVNGPPRSGKDTLASFFDYKVFKFAEYIKDGTHKSLGLNVKSEQFDKNKDVPNKLFFGKKPRDCYIAFSESYMKPLFGDDIFGKILCKNIKQNTNENEVIFVTDSGFANEALILVEEFGYKNVFLFKIEREGTSFSNDSRSYIDLSEIGVQEFKIKNNGTLKEFAAEAIDVIESLKL